MSDFFNKHFNHRTVNSVVVTIIIIIAIINILFIARLLRHFEIATCSNQFICLVRKRLDLATNHSTITSPSPHLLPTLLNHLHFAFTRMRQFILLLLTLPSLFLTLFTCFPRIKSFSLLSSANCSTSNSISLYFATACEHINSPNSCFSNLQSFILLASPTAPILSILSLRTTRLSSSSASPRSASTTPILDFLPFAHSQQIQSKKERINLDSFHSTLLRQHVFTQTVDLLIALLSSFYVSLQIHAIPRVLAFLPRFLQQFDGRV